MSVCVSPQDGELVTFSEVEGMPQLNGHKGIKVKNCKVRHGAPPCVTHGHGYGTCAAVGPYSGKYVCMACDHCQVAWAMAHTFL